MFYIKIAAAAASQSVAVVTINLAGLGFRTGGQKFNLRSDPAFGTVAHFEANKAKYIEAIAAAYGYDPNLIDVNLKPGSVTEVVVTFRVPDEATLMNLQNTMKNEDTLQNNLNNNLNDAGAKLSDDSPISNGAVTDLAGRSAY